MQQHAGPLDSTSFWRDSFHRKSKFQPGQYLVGFELSRPDLVGFVGLPSRHVVLFWGVRQAKADVFWRSKTPDRESSDVLALSASPD